MGSADSVYLYGHVSAGNRGRTVRWRAGVCSGFRDRVDWSDDCDAELEAAGREYVGKIFFFLFRTCLTKN